MGRSEVGAKHWNYTIHSALNTPADIVRVKNVLVSQYRRAKATIADDDEEKEVK